MAQTLGSLLKAECVNQMSLSIDRIRKCVAQLTEEQIWMRANEESNSIGNLLLHLNGNITQWILSGLGGAEDHRERDAEFAQRDALNADELVLKLEATIRSASSVISDLSDEKLVEPMTIQGFETNVTGAVIHVVEHLSYHTGQIAWQTKALSSKDLGFYSGLDLNKTNE